jgi:NADH-quinone oxidoreductase subunit G
MRVWFLKETPSLCPESSAGVNTLVSSREGVIHRITPRRNDEVNDTWMSDSGRELYKQVAAENRLKACLIDGQAATEAMALQRAADLLVAGGVAVVGSGRQSVEEQFLTQKIAGALKAPAWLVSRITPGDGLLISADRNPNVRGALVTGLIRQLPSAGLAELAAQIDRGAVKTVLAVNEDLAAAGLAAAQLAKVAVIYLGTHASATSAAARVVLPALTIFEKSGTFINQQFRLQKFSQAVPGPAGVRDDLATLAALAVRIGAGAPVGTVESLWKQLAAEVPVLATSTFQNIPATGLLLDATAWADLPYAEGEALHYQPARPAAATT